MNNIRERICNSKRIVIKVGSSTLTYENGNINISKIEKLSRVISDLLNQDKEVILVTSAAIAVGKNKLKIDDRAMEICDKQAAAAIGQCELMNMYSKFFAEYGYTVAQLLITRDVIDEKERMENVTNTFKTLLSNRIIPIVNENDTVSTEEIKFGDNDTLSSIVAKLVNADLLIVLSDVDGLYDSDPRKNKDSKRLSVIEKITPEIEQFAGGKGSDRGTGGMKTKISAAKIATSAGIDMIIANGKNIDIIRDIMNGEDIGTIFIANSI